MCLKRVTKSASHGRHLNPIGYKIYRECSGGYVQGGLYPQKYKIGTTNFYNCGTKKGDEIDDYRNKYNPGFHILTNIYDAIRVKQESYSSRTICLVEYKDILHHGYESQFGWNMDCIIAAKMRIVKILEDSEIKLYLSDLVGLKRKFLENYLTND